MRAKKSLGQNFLTDDYTIQRIIQAIHPQAEDHIIEIGPGHGALTEHLYSTVARFDAIELDTELSAKLQTKYSAANLHIHNQDALQFDFTAFDASNKLKIVGNLPYNVATPIIIKLLQEEIKPRFMVFMLQLEVAQRLAAKGGKNYGRLSLLCQYYADCELLFNVAADAFTPRPKVTSCVILLTPRPFSLKAHDINHLENLIKQAFNHRRKTIKKSLHNVVTATSLEQITINPNARPEELQLTDFIKLSNYLISKG